MNTSCKSCFTKQNDQRTWVCMRRAVSSSLAACAGFDWERVNFLHSSWGRAVFWICTGNIVDNTHDLVTAEQGSHSIKAFSVSHITPPVSWMGMQKDLGGFAARMADLN